jgi:hypothetical protein
MRRYGFLGIAALVMFLAALRILPSAPAQAAPALGVTTPSSTPTATATATSTKTPTKTSTPTKTPTVVWLLPFVAKQPTLTPTSTSTPSPTWTPSQTPTTFSCPGRFDGSISLEDNKPTYATYIEWVKFIQWVHNNNDSTTCFGILGFDAIQPDGSHMQYNSQWNAQGVPSQYLTISANCWGPNGQPCAGSQGSGQQEDHVGTGPYLVTQEGQYTIYYTVCYSTFNACLSPGSNWAVLGSIQFTAINWTPTPPSGPSGTEIAPTPTTPPSTGPVCFLITNDPRGMYLNCNTPHLKERQLFHH